MLQVEDMPVDEMHDLLNRVGVGHLGCINRNRPYVVPIHYAYDSQAIYFFTTEESRGAGLQTCHLSSNERVLGSDNRSYVMNVSLALHKIIGRKIRCESPLTPGKFLPHVLRSGLPLLKPIGIPVRPVELSSSAFTSLFATAHALQAVRLIFN